MADLADGKDAASPFFNVERNTLRFIWARNLTSQKFYVGAAGLINATHDQFKVGTG